jgi:hypothetical protein
MRPRSATTTDAAPAPVPPPLSPTFKDDISHFRVADFATDFFKSRRVNRTFVRRQLRLPPTEVFQAEPLRQPLLCLADKSSGRTALEMFKVILSYTGAGGAPPPAPKQGVALLRQFVKTGADVPELRDELYFQLIKQTRANRQPECARRTWELFLVLATFVPSTRTSEAEVRAHLQAEGQRRGAPAADIAQFTAIRYATRCVTGREGDVDALAPDALARVLREPFDGGAVFGASVAEQLWHQRARWPRAPIPVVLHAMRTHLIARGAREALGVFGASGSARENAILVASLDEGCDPDEVLARASPYDIAVLFKQWFFHLPGKIVTVERSFELRTIAKTSRGYVPFADALPAPERLALMYAIGLLRELLAAEEATQMGERGFATVFAPVLVAASPAFDHAALMKHIELAQDFIVALIRDWDTREVYPLRPEHLQGPSSPAS